MKTRQSKAEKTMATPEDFQPSSIFTVIVHRSVWPGTKIKVEVQTTTFMKHNIWTLPKLPNGFW